jgi:trans-aconitate methyltransferase
MQTEQYQLHASLEDRHWWFTARRRIMRELVHHVLPCSRSTLVVDVGCGTGANVEALAHDFDCVGIDPSPEAIALARRRFPKCHFVCGHAPGDLGALMGQARLVLLMDVLEHVPDDFAFLSSLLAASSRGTYFLLTVPANPTFWSAHDESNGHYRRYDVGRLQSLCAELPVVTLLMSHYNARLYPIASAVRSWSQWRGRATGRAGTDVSLPPAAIDAALGTIFAGESRVLLDVLRGQRHQGYASGLSLVALLRREAGAIAAWERPSDVAPDSYGTTNGARGPGRGICHAASCHCRSVF